MMVIVIVVNELVIFARLTEISLKRLQHCFRIRSTQGPLGMTFVVQGEGLIIVLVPLLRQFARLRHLHRDIHIESSHCNHVSWVLIPFFPVIIKPSHCFRPDRQYDGMGLPFLLVLPDVLVRLFLSHSTF